MRRLQPCIAPCSWSRIPFIQMGVATDGVDWRRNPLALTPMAAQHQDTCWRRYAKAALMFEFFIDLVWGMAPLRGGEEVG